jgi:hypothetical protein
METVSHGIQSELNPAQRKYADKLLAQAALIAPGRKPQDMTPRERVDFEKIVDAVEEFLETRQTPKQEITREFREAVAEVFAGEEMDEIEMPPSEELTDEYFDRMYPAAQRPEDKKRGLISARSSLWKDAVSKDMKSPAGETWGDAFIRSLRGDATKFGGKTLMTETIQIPISMRNGAQQYGTVEGIAENLDPLLPVIKAVFGNEVNRFGHSWDKLTTQLLPAVKKKIEDNLKSKGMPVPEFEVILTPAITANQQMTNLRPENSTGSTQEWTSTVLLEYDGTETDTRLIVGADDEGGAAAVGGMQRNFRWNFIGFRLSVVLD